MASTLDFSLPTWDREVHEVGARSRSSNPWQDRRREHDQQQEQFFSSENLMSSGRRMNLATHQSSETLDQRRKLRPDEQLGRKPREEFERTEELSPRDADKSDQAEQLKLTKDIQELTTWLAIHGEKIGGTVTALRGLQKHIASDMDIDSKMVETHFSSTLYRRSSLPRSFTKESSRLEEVWLDQIAAVQDVLREVCDCMSSRKSAYRTQLQRVRDNANAAIRNAMQVERAETLMTCQRLREEYAAQQAQTMEKHAATVQTLQTEIQSLRQNEQHLLQRNDLLQERDRQRVILEHEAVERAVEKLRGEHRVELVAVRAQHNSETETLRREHAQTLDRLREQHTIYIERVVQQERAAQQKVEEEKRALEEEVRRVRDECNELHMQLRLAKESAHHQLEVLQTQNERALSEQLAESLRVQAGLKAQMAQTLQSQQQVDRQRQTEIEQQIQRMRDHLIQDHTYEMERMQDAHRREMKRLQSELEVRHEESTTRLKHLHEAELQRQIRLTERLQRIIERHNLPVGSLTAEVETTGYSAHHNTQSAQVYTSLTPTRRITSSPSPPRRDRPPTTRPPQQHTREMSRSPSPPPPPPVPQSVSRQEALPHPLPPPPLSSSSAAGPHRGLPWGRLRDSLSAQERLLEQPKFSPNHLPPSTLDLDAAVFAAERQSNRHEHTEDTGEAAPVMKGLGVAGNVRRVSSYLQALEDYLEGDDRAVRDLSLSSAATSSLGDLFGRRSNNNKPRGEDSYSEDSVQPTGRGRAEESSDSEVSQSPLEGMRVLRREQREREKLRSSQSTTSSSSREVPALMQTSLSDT